MKSKKVLGWTLMIYALSLVLMWVMHFHYIYIGTQQMLHSQWMIFVSITFQTAVVIIIWLFLFGFTRIWATTSKVSRFVESRLLIISFSLYAMLLLGFGVSVGIYDALTGYFPLTQDYRRFSIHRYFTYLVNPFVIWLILLFRQKLSDNDYATQGPLKKKATICPLMYLTVWFVFAMIIGHTLDVYGYVEHDGVYVLEKLGGAFAYFYIDPSFWVHWSIFGVFMVMLVSLLWLASLVVVWLTNKVNTRREG